jgi:hypothetical protein
MLRQHLPETAFELLARHRNRMTWSVSLPDYTTRYQAVSQLSFSRTTFGFTCALLSRTLLQ